MEAKWTPGPWRVKADGSNVILSNDQNDDLVATTRLYSEKGAANAYLIAAAPDLYEALRDLIALAAGAGLEGACIHGQHSGRPATLDAARAALASATPKAVRA
jgi:UDP-N-acetylenolpyruvoylglucosamine reductase